MAWYTLDMRALYFIPLLLLVILALKEESEPHKIRRAFIEAAQDADAHVCESNPNLILKIEAQKQAELQAKLDVQGHQRWSKRYKYLQHKLGNEFTFSEICAETWKRQADCTPLEIATEFFHCWKQSPGHWKTAKAAHHYYGCGMAQGKSGVWYGCIIVADKK